MFFSGCTGCWKEYTKLTTSVVARDGNFVKMTTSFQYTRVFFKITFKCWTHCLVSFVSYVLLKKFCNLNSWLSALFNVTVAFKRYQIQPIRHVVSSNYISSSSSNDLSHSVACSTSNRCLKQSWLFLNWTSRNKGHSNFNQYTNIFIQEKVFE